MQQELFVKLVLDSWNSHVSRTDKLFDSLTDEQLQHEIAPGRNRGIYLLGHLTAVHDRMLPLLGFGPQLHPELDVPFITSPDKTVQDLPSATELRAQWKEVNVALDGHIKSLQPADWFARHTSVSEEDFAKEPHRNRLNIIISRTGHLAGHLGQLIYLK
jgi:DinB family protein